MSSDPLEALTNKLCNTQVCGEGVSFVGKSLKLNNADDAKVVTDAIAACQNMEFLNLEGNTLGVDAARAIGMALGSHTELRRALWKDMFTGRMKDEIPQALRYLGGGLEVANARLVELDLSDNAFGPIGMEGLASLLRSPACHTLQELRLNNNGLGITGAKLLSTALMDCYERSKISGNPLPLRVFIAGRNRLENEGITALSRVFKIIGSLEEVQIPQNGIYHPGISQLSEALKRNPGLRVLNLNDNTLGPKGSVSLASALPSLQLLRVLNLGDCLLKTAGAISLATGLHSHANLEELIADHNEIRKEGGVALVKSLQNKHKLRLINLDGNQFGDEGIDSIKAEVKKNNQSGILGSLSEDEGENSDDEGEDGEESEEEESDAESDQEKSIVNSSREQSFVKTNGVSKPQLNQSSSSSVGPSLETAMMNLLKEVTTADFLKFPTPERFLALKTNKSQQILTELKRAGDTDSEYLERLLAAVMKVSSLATESTVAQAALDCSNSLYRELFSWAQTHNNLSTVNNSLLVHLGLIKSEDKKWKAEYNQAGCRLGLKQAMSQNYFPTASRDTVTCFLQRKNENIETITLS